MKTSIVFKLVLVASFFLFFSTDASLPRMHIYLAEKCLDKKIFENQDQKSEFLLGNLFPDIRYMGVVSREKTHEAKISLDRIFSKESKESFFALGMKFHSWVDEEREKFLFHHAIMNEISDIPYSKRSLFLKLIEDEILVEQEEKFDVAFLLDVNFNELKYVSWSDASKWHLMLSEYFCARPSRILYFFSQMKMSFWGIAPEELACWSTRISLCLKNPKIRGYYRDLVEHFQGQIGFVE
jgi:hypothetical protein